jgi:putative FmdB family regulatory protein
MPIYEYQCNACGHKMEAFQSISEAALLTCPECKKDKLDKLISASGFHLKGTGWYKTDYSPTKANKDKSASVPKTEPAAKDTGDKKA